MILEEPPERALLPRAKGFRKHFWAFAGATALIIALNVLGDAGLPMFWPLAAWSVAVAVHYFIASCLDVEEAWVDERAEEIRMRSYDFDHIDQIKRRVAERHDSVTHHVERDPNAKRSKD